MKSGISKRLLDIVDALPLYDGIKVLEIGCGPGAAAREVSRRICSGHILAIDRSAKAIQQAVAISKSEIESGRLSFKQTSIENFESEPGEQFDLIFATRVGALDGRHPDAGKLALEKISQILKPGGHLIIDGMPRTL